MKKAYSKPQILFDSFELSQSIALGCEMISNQSKGSCTVTDPILDLVYITDNACQGHYTEPGIEDRLCYYAPDDAYNVYSS